MLVALPDAFTRIGADTSRNWPALVVGVIVAVYWARVMAMVRHSRKTAGHGANLVPREPVGRALRVVWFPVTVLWIFLPFVAFFVRHRQRFPGFLRTLLGTYPLPLMLRWAAAAVAVACLLATFVCWQRMGTSWRMGIDPDDRTQLVCSGPYAYVRHPIYGLSSLLMVATVIAVPSPLMILVGVLHVILLQWEARREEAHLSRVHGEAYRAYARGTGRFLPKSLRPYAESKIEP
jgi:protein-S-isoprenylcysteine O-methyltransferase Ste14